MKIGSLVKLKSGEHCAKYYKGRVWRIETLNDGIAGCSLYHANGETGLHFFPVESLEEYREP